MGNDIRDDLKDVLIRVIDSADGYEKAAEAADSSRFAQIFRRRSVERRAFSADLRAELVSQGGDADEDGTLLASAHRVFMGLKAKMSDTDEAVLEEVARGESNLVDAYEDALEDMPAGTPSRMLLEKQLMTVRQNLADARLAEEVVD